MREIFVEENVPIGHELGRIFAVDEDSGRNGEIHYSLRNIEKNNSEILNNINLAQNDSKNFNDIEEMFNLNEISGILTTKVVLDREVRDNYCFQVSIF